MKKLIRYIIKWAFSDECYKLENYYNITDETVKQLNDLSKAVNKLADLTTIIAHRQ